jgi:hypothetical protein
VRPHRSHSRPDFAGTNRIGGLQTKSYFGEVAPQHPALPFTLSPSGRHAHIPLRKSSPTNQTLQNLSLRMRFKLLLIGLAALLQMSCSETGNTSGQPESAGEMPGSGPKAMPQQSSVRQPPQ